MTSFEFGDVVLVPFPFTDQSTTKQRPGVVVSSASYHRHRPDLILMALTGRVRDSSFPGEQKVDSWNQAGLLKPSVFKPLLATIDRRIVRRRLGQLSQPDRGTLAGILEHILGS